MGLGWAWRYAGNSERIHVGAVGEEGLQGEKEDY